MFKTGKFSDKNELFIIFNLYFLFICLSVKQFALCLIFYNLNVKYLIYIFFIVAGSRVFQFLKVLLTWIKTVFGSINPLGGKKYK